jgi:hypothetical protein
MKEIKTTKKISLRFQTLESIRFAIRENLKNNKKNLFSELNSNGEYMGSLKITNRFHNNFRFLKDSDKSFFEKLKELSFKISDDRRKELSKQIFDNEEIYKKICVKNEYYKTIREFNYYLRRGQIVDLAEDLLNLSMDSEDIRQSIHFFGCERTLETDLLLIDLCKIDQQLLEKENISLKLYFNNFTKLFTFKKMDIDPKLNCLVENLFIEEIKFDYSEIKDLLPLTIEDIKSAFIDKVERLVNFQYNKFLEQSFSLEKENNYKIKDLKRIISISNRDMLSNLLEKELPMDEIRKLNYVERKEFLSILEEILL